MRKILITGANGYIGSFIKDHLKVDNSQIIGIDISIDRDPNLIKLDISNGSKLKKFVDKIQPNFIIHCAGIKDLDECENNKIAAFSTNVLSTEVLGSYSRKNNCKFIYISSDVIFNGENGNYKIEDLPSPLNWYGKLKVFSEIIIRDLPSYAILRTALVIGPISDNYKKLLNLELNNDYLKNQTLLPHYILKKLRNNQGLRLPDQIISNPTPVELLVKAIANVITKDINGTFHTAGNQSISRYAFANLIADIFSLNTELIEIDNTNISLLRPKNISMEVLNSYKSLGLNKKDWDLNKYLLSILDE